MHEEQKRDEQKQNEQMQEEQKQDKQNDQAVKELISKYAVKIADAVVSELIETEK